MPKLTAYKNKPELKALLMEEVASHRKNDQIIQGTYGQENGKWKGCAVGCAIHSLNIKLNKNHRTSDHKVYETELGIPRQLAYLEDRIFEGLEIEKAKLWPERFLGAIKPGADLSMVVPKFMLWVLEEVLPFAKKNNRAIEAIQTVIELYKRLVSGGKVEKDEWVSARKAAAYAAADAAYAAADAAYAAADAAYAAYAAAYAAYAAYADAAADAAPAAARLAFYEKMADKLVELLSN